MTIPATGPSASTTLLLAWTGGVTDPILSDKDKNAPLLADSDCNFVYGKGE